MDSRSRRMLEALKPIENSLKTGSGPNQVDQKSELKQKNSLPKDSAQLSRSKKSTLLDRCWNGRLPIDNGEIWRSMPFENCSFIHAVSWENIDKVRAELNLDEHVGPVSKYFFENQEHFPEPPAKSPFQEKTAPNDDVNVERLHEASALLEFYTSASTLLKLDSKGLLGTMEVQERPTTPARHKNDDMNEPHDIAAHTEPAVSTHDATIEALEEQQTTPTHHEGHLFTTDEVNESHGVATLSGLAAYDNGVHGCPLGEPAITCGANLHLLDRENASNKSPNVKILSGSTGSTSSEELQLQTTVAAHTDQAVATYDNISITSNAMSSLLNCQNSEASSPYHLDSDDSYNDPHFENELSDYMGSPSSDEEIEEVGKKKQASTVAQEKGEIASTSRDGEDPPKKKRKRTANPNAWKDNISKKRRNHGESYTTKRTQKVVSERKVRPGCGEKCEFQCTAKIDSHARFRIFQRFWGLGDIGRQRDYISRMIKEITPQYRYPKEKSSRKPNVAYYFRIDGQKKRVCRTFFTATLDISPRMIYTAREKLVDGVMVGELRGKHRNHKKLPESVKEDCRAHIRKLNRIESHYLRAQTEREYIEGGRSIAQIYRDYVDSCRQEGKKFASRTVFFDVFDEFNISFYVPKKDQCEVCVAYENSDHQDRQEEYAAHLEEKKLSRIEKENDKSNTDKSVIVCTYDLQAALPTPKGDVSVFYYRSKLSTYNLTVYDIKERIATCNVWHEGEGNRGAIEISTSVFKFIEKKANEAADRDIEFIFYSDNCTGQQKNKYTIMMYMFALCLFENVKAIQHKFLIKGHTQNEGDSVHSLIEKEVKRALKVGPIFVPAQYYQIMKTAKKNPPYHQVNELTHRDFIDFKGLTHLIGENFTVNQKNETFPFGDLKVIKVCQDNPFVFQYKTTYQAKDFESVDTNWSKKKRRSTRASSDVSVDEQKENLKNWTVKKAYNGRISIAENKKRDLKYLVDNKYIKPYYADFYNNLLYLPRIFLFHFEAAMFFTLYSKVKLRIFGPLYGL